MRGDPPPYQPGKQRFTWPVSLACSLARANLKGNQVTAVLVEAPAFVYGCDVLFGERIIYWVKT
jgi:hypothetical protein